MKKLINDPRRVVEEMIEGLVALYPGLCRLADQTVLIRADAEEARDRQAALIVGGGSGHEPAHAGYVGKGMLGAAVAGDVFTSPSPDAVHAAIRAVAGPMGALLIVKNYTGDRLNFGLAAERARAEGIPVEIVIVADDVALGEGSAHAGRRGLAGTILVHKIAGALAASGASLAEVAAAARAAAEVVRTMGVALTPCTVPAAGKPGFSLGENEVELGLGIHGEPGVRRIPLEPADLLVDRLLDCILAETTPGRIALMINNLGGTPAMELAIVARHAITVLAERGFSVERVYCGTFLSALEMAGVSLSVLPVDDRRLALLDAPTDAPAWFKAMEQLRPRTTTVPSGLPTAQRIAQQPQTPLGHRLDRGIRAWCLALIEAEQRLTDLDQAVGDGDLGISLTRGAQAVLAALPTTPLDDPAAALADMGLTLQRALGGTSGPLYAVFLLHASRSLRLRDPDSAAAWVEAFRAGCEGIAALGGAARGERTMLDALLPAVDALTAGLGAGRSVRDLVQGVASAAEAGARDTASMSPKRGRSSYLGERVLGQPDPGAVAVAIGLRALASAVDTNR